MVTVEDIEGVTFVDRSFFSTEMKVWARPPFKRDDPLYNERAHDYRERISALAFKEGFEKVALEFR